METSIHYVEKVEFGKIKKRVVKKTERVFYDREIHIRSKDETLTVIMFADSPDKLIQKRGKNE